jgi:hypothetical protein
VLFTRLCFLSVADSKEDFMSNRNWWLGVSQSFVLLTLFTYVGSMIGCGPAETPLATKTAPSDDHDHDEGHDHDHDGHDHDDHDHDEIDVDGLMPISTPETPETLAAGVQQLVALRDEIAKGFAADDVDSIHDQLHGVGNLLESIGQLTEASELSAEAKEQATKAVEVLFDAYGQVDQKLHGDDGKDYADVSSDIDAAVQTLTKLELAPKGE